VESLDQRSGSERQVHVDTLVIHGFEFQFAGLQDGTVSSLDFSSMEKRNCDLLAPLFVLALNFGTKLTEVDFCGLDFGKSTDSVVGATLSLAEGGTLLKCNKIGLRPDHDLAELNIQGCPVMPHGICVLASTTMAMASTVT
jgi:hypothetical protein